MARGLALLLTVLGLILPATAAASHAGPLAGEWHLDGDFLDLNSDSGRSTADSSGHGLHASTSPPANYEPGKFGNAYTPVDFSIIRAPDSAQLEPARVTALAWVRANATPEPLQHVVAKGADGCAGSSYALLTDFDGRLVFDVYDGVARRRTPAAPLSLWDGQWHMVAGTFDGSALRLYVDGVEIGGTAAPGTNLAYGLGEDEFRIGSYPLAPCSGFDTYFEGAIDEVRVYTRALSGSELGRLAAATGPTPPVLEPDGGGAGGAAAPPPLPRPRFTTAKSAQLRRAVWLNGSMSDIPAGLSVTKYSWDFNGDGRFEVECSGDTPAVSRPVRRAGNYNVTLQITDSLNRVSSVTQPFSVARSQINRSAKSVSTCERPLGTNQPDRADCIKTFAFGMVEVNGRGEENQCFKLTSRPKDLKTKRLFSSQRGRRLQDFMDYHATIAGPVAINGLPLPIPSNRVTEYDGGRDTISGGRLPLAIPVPGHKQIRTTVPLELKVSPDRKGRFELPPLEAAGKVTMTGLKLGGGLQIALLRNRKSEIKISVVLPDVFNFVGKREAKGHVVLQASNQGGFEFEGLRIAQIPQVFIGPLLVNNLFFEYQRTGEIWRGGANFQLAAVSPVQIKAAPPPPEYGFGLREGRFDYAGGGVAFPLPPRPQVFPGVGLTEIGGSIGVQPLRFTGRIGIDVAGFIVLDGSAFVGLASPDQPYDFPEEFAPPGLGFLAGRRLDSVSIAVGGQASFNVPVIGDLPLVNSYVFYAYPDYAEFGGGFGFNILEELKINGNVGGFVAIGSRIFNLEGEVQVCLDIDVLDICKGIHAVISSKGIGVCTVVPIPVSPFGPAIPVDAGVGYHWGGDVSVMIGSCDAGPYREARPSARGAQAGSSFRLARGLPSAMVRVRGQGGAPEVELNGPRGIRALAPQTDQALVREDVFVLRRPAKNETLIGLVKPAAGRWTVRAREGSVPIAGVATAEGLRSPRIRARVRGKGRKRVLRYSMRRDPGQRVTFVEQGARTFRVLGATTRAKGRIAFTPGPGRGGRRDIAALVERGGIVTRRMVVARYKAPGIRRPAKPRRLRAKRKRSVVTGSWLRVPGAFRYAATLQLRNGESLFRVTRRRKVRFAGVNRLARGRLLVRGITKEGLPGREAKRKLPARKASRKGARKRSSKRRGAKRR